MPPKVNRSAKTGRFAPKKAAKQSPATTVTERIGKGTHNAQPVNRSAKTGRFVTDATAKRNPGTTMKQWV